MAVEENQLKAICDILRYLLIDGLKIDINIHTRRLQVVHKEDKTTNRPHQHDSIDDR